MAGVSDVITLIQTMHSGITGVTSAPTAYPGSIDTAELPMVLTFPGPAETVLRTQQQVKRQSIRTYSARLYVEPANQDIYDNVAQTTITLLQRFLDEYYDTYVLANNLAHIVSVSDSGLVSGATAADLLYAGVAYTGVIFDLEVLEWTDTIA